MIAFWWRKHFVREFPGNSTHDSLSRFRLWNSESAPMLNLASAREVFNSLCLCKCTGEHSTNGEGECFKFWLWFSLFSSFPHFFFFSTYHKAPKHRFLLCLPPEAHWHGWSAPSWDGKLPGGLESQKVLAVATILSQDSKVYWFSYSSSNQTNVIYTNFHFLLLCNNWMAKMSDKKKERTPGPEPASLKKLGLKRSQRHKLLTVCAKKQMVRDRDAVSSPRGEAVAGFKPC